MRSSTTKHPAGKKQATAKPKTPSFWSQAIDVDLTERYAKIAFLILTVLSFIILPWGSQSIGIPSDEPIDMEYGKAAYQFYTTGGEERLFENLSAYGGDVTRPDQKYYGALFEGFTYTVAELLGTSIFPTRHLLTAIVGCFIFLFVGLTVKEAKGWLAALIALLLILATPSFLGQTLYNTKDTPFALGFVLSIYFTLRIGRSLPKISALNLLGLFAGIVFAVGIRIGGVLAIGFVGFTLLLYLIIRRKEILTPQNYKALATTTGLVTVSCLLGSLVGLLSYPNFWLHPTTHVQSALRIMQDFPTVVPVLFEGQLISSNKLPWYYLPKYLGIALPLLLWMGVAAWLALSIFHKKDLKFSAVLLFCFAFPPAYILYTNAPIYNGWRHVMFAIPFLIMLSSLGWYYLIKLSSRNMLVLSMVVLTLSVGIGKLTAWSIKYHPYQYIYLNHTVGGVAGAFAKYDLDYQNLAVYQCLNWLERKRNINNVTQKTVVGTNNMAARYSDLFKGQYVSYNATAFRSLYLLEWDYAVMTSIFLRPEAFKYFFPPKHSAMQVTVEGVPLAFVAERQHKLDMQAAQLVQANRVAEAYPLLVKSYKHDPERVNIYPMLAHYYFTKGDKTKADQFLAAYDQLFPNDNYVKQLRELYK